MKKKTLLDRIDTFTVYLYRSFLSNFAQNFTCARKRLGGKWEKWLSPCGPVWLQVAEFTSITGKRPGGCFYGGDETEDYSSNTQMGSKTKETGTVG
jgi:hypothetical protein